VDARELRRVQRPRVSRRAAFGAGVEPRDGVRRRGASIGEPWPLAQGERLRSAARALRSRIEPGRDRSRGELQAVRRGSVLISTKQGALPIPMTDIEDLFVIWHYTVELEANA
jgi:hypothetical protein